MAGETIAPKRSPFSGIRPNLQYTEVDSDSSAQRKTKINNTEQGNSDVSNDFVNQVDVNVLNSYRSITYNFTLAAVTQQQSNQPELFDARNPKYVVASSKGKPVMPTSNLSNESNQRSVDSTKENSAKKTQKSNQQRSSTYVKDTVTGFNKNSPGRFDLFIDNVMIDTVMAFKDGVASLPVNIAFDVIEPYSLNGFIEALQVAALSTGFNDYIAADYVLILDFMGYPDKGSTPLPEPIPMSSRVFYMRITGIQVSVTEEGTLYKVLACPVSDRAASSSVATIKTKMSGSGNTVKQFLQNFIKGLNDQAAEDAKASSNNANQNFDSYAILFPKYDKNGVIIPNDDNEIASAKFWDDSDSANVNAKMRDVGNSPNNFYNSYYDEYPSSSTSSYEHTANFDTNQSITDIIQTVIRDSNYLKKIIKSLQDGNAGADQVVDANGFINHFVITPKVLIKEGTMNVDTNRPYCIYVYLVEPYKVLYNSAIPGASNQIIDTNKLQKLALRKYRYFYTGLNVDILDFKINLNNLFFEEVPKALGNNQVDPSASAAKAGGTNNIIKTDKNDSKADRNTVGITPIYATANAGSAKPNDTINSAVPDSQPWTSMVKLMHEKITNSVGLISGDLNILGDPYYVTAAGSGNSLNKGSKIGQLANDGEASLRAGRLLISLAFNNPSDIDKSGFMAFSNSPIPISGLYQVIECKSSFRDGLFKQTLKILRVPGQALDSSQVPDLPSAIYGSYPKPEDVVSVSSGPPPANQLITTNDGSQGVRATSLNLSNVISNAGTENLGGLGGNNNQVLGAVNPAANLPTAVYGIIPNGANQLASGIRASAAGLVQSQTKNLSQAALVESAAVSLNSVYPNSNSILKSMTGNLINNQYDLKNVLNANSLNNAAQSGVANLLGNIGDKINQTIHGNLSLSSLFGVRPSQISKLSGGVDSTVLSKLNGLSEVIPPNVNLKTASNQGVSLDGLTADGLSKLPPIPQPATGIRNPGFNNVLVDTNNAQPQFPQIDNYIRASKEISSFDLYGKISGNALSVEGQNKISDNNLTKSVINQYGSKSVNEISPLLNALNNNNYS